MAFWQRWFTAAEQEIPVPLPIDRLACRPAVAAEAASYRPAVLVNCGSFNPPTNLHMRMFEVAKDHLTEEGYDVLGGYMSPVNDAYGKKGLLNAEHRLRMAQACAESSEFVMVDAWEASQQGYQRTLKVLSRIQNSLRSMFSENAEIVNNAVVQGEPVRAFLLCGSDLLESMAKPNVWLPDQVESLLKNHGLVCVSRDTVQVEEIFKKDALLQSHRGFVKVVEDPVTNNMSSTLIRDLLKQGKSIKYLVPDAALAYIKEKGLYK